MPHSPVSGPPSGRARAGSQADNLPQARLIRAATRGVSPSANSEDRGDLPATWGM